ncbi:MAG: secondary thiamine-phosphate synthase enzyme YjbQ [Candidatus Desulfofervidus auxilii]|nr:secondary thiamine-phosphate synthase enzyme YjbQ [Candidatus Desulfofervidus auxilii]
MVFTKTLTISTKEPGDIVDLTPLIVQVVKESGIKNGIVHVFAPHATGVFALTELESNLIHDIKHLLEEITPQGKGWHHPANAHSHLRSMLLPPDHTLPVRDGKPITGTWQSLFFIEVGLSGRHVRIEITVIGE